MSSIMGEVLSILRCLEQCGAFFPKSMSPEDIREAVGLDKEHFDRGLYYLSQVGYVDGSKQEKWLTPKGIDFLEQERPRMSGLTLRAERLLRKAVSMASPDSVGVVFRDRAIEAIGLTDEQYQDAAQELADHGLIEEYGNRVNAPPFHMFGVMPEGRKLDRRGYRREVQPTVGAPQTTVEQHIDEIVNVGGNLQVTGVASGPLSRIINDPQLLQQRVEALGQQLLEAFQSELSDLKAGISEQVVGELKEALLSGQPNKSRIESALRDALSLSADAEGTLSLMLRVLPVLFQFGLIAATRLHLP